MADGVHPATGTQITEGRSPSRFDREEAAAAVRGMQDALVPQVEALFDSLSGQDVMEAFDHLGRAADALHHAVPGARDKALSELLKTAELLRTSAGRSTQAAIALSPIAAMVEEAARAVETWPITHAGTQGAQAFGADDARLVLTQPEPGMFVLTDQGNEVGRFAAEGDAMETLAQYALPEDDPNQGVPFNVFLAPEGFESGDGRLLELGTTTWRDPPLPYMMQDTSSHGPGSPAPAWFAGAIERVWRDPSDASRIIGRGHLVPGADGQRAEAAIRAGFRGVSIDGIGMLPPTEQITTVDGEGNPVTALLRYSDTKIMGATGVAHPAFEPCCIWFDDEATPERVTATHGQDIPFDAAPAVLESEPLAALVASAGGPKNPPKAWFTKSPPDHYVAPTVTPEGQFYGHLGKAGTCHIGQVGSCVTIPASATGYKFFHRTVAATAEGENVACGWLTMDTSHASLRHTAQAASSHYEHSGTQVAKIRIVDTPNGPWAAGAVAPGLDEQTIWKLQGPEVSGDWRDIDGHYRELVAVLAVPLPGFLTQRPEALVASGQIVAQIGTLPCDQCGPSPLAAEIEAAFRQPISAEAMALMEANPGVLPGMMESVLRHHDQALRALRPQVVAAIREKVSPDEMVEQGKRAAAVAPWRERLRVK